MVQRVLIAPPASQIGPLTATERQQLIQSSALQARYAKAFDRESAYELLLARAKQASDESTSKPAATASKEDGSGLGAVAGGVLGALASQVVKSTVRQLANRLGRELVRGLLGSLKGRR
jgi:hypothetical protein